MDRQLIRMNDGRLNVANLFTFSRLPLALLGMAVYGWLDQRLIGVIIIALAAWSDFFDGLVARRFNCETDFGAKFDPIIDKVFMVLVAVLTYVVVPDGRWIILLIGATEIANAVVTILTNLVKHSELKVTWFGKKGMFGRMSCVTWLLLSSCGTGGFYGFMYNLAIAAGVIGVSFGVVAFFQYVGQLRRL